MTGTRTRIGLWLPQVGIAGGRGGLHVHYALQIADGDFDAAVERLRERGYHPESSPSTTTTEAARCTSRIPMATSSSALRVEWWMAGSISVSVGLDARRVSDQDREQAVLSLRDDLLAGRLTLDEFSERVEIAYRAKIGQDLVRVRHDLPELSSATVGSGRRQKRLTIAFCGSVIRRGRLRLRRRTLVISAFGNVDLDLREAEMHDPRVAVRIFVAFGNVDLYVPEGINVEVGGTIIFGRLREWGRNVVRADAPTVSVRSLGCVGTVDVWRVPHEMRGSYSEIFGQLETQQRQLPA